MLRCPLVSYFLCDLAKLAYCLCVRPVYNALEVIRAVFDAGHRRIVNISGQEIVVCGR
tara:strand:+ start:243 stop:416 length:174 start_codon:yes stop_codon:yes gene_type:complete